MNENVCVCVAFVAVVNGALMFVCVHQELTSLNTDNVEDDDNEDIAESSKGLCRCGSL